MSNEILTVTVSSNAGTNHFNQEENLIMSKENMTVEAITQMVEEPKSESVTAPTQPVITIDPEFENLLPKQTPEQDKELEAQILREGCNTPLVVWEVNDTHILVDGHRRFAICQKHNRQFTVRKQSFANREEAKFWAVMEQLTRRNLNSFLRIEHALRFKPMFEARAKANQQAGNALRQNSAQAVEMVKTRDEVAKLAGVSHHTVSRVEDILAKANQPGLEKTIARAIKKAINALRNDEATINGVYQEYFGKKDSQPKERNPKTVSQARKENVKSDGDAFTRRIEETMNAVDAMRSAVDAVKGAFQSLFQDDFQTDEAVLQTMLVSANEPCKSLIELIAELQGKVASHGNTSIVDCPKDSSDFLVAVAPDGRYDAKGELTGDGEKCRVSAGSIVNPQEASNLWDEASKKRKELMETGVIVDGKFMQDYVFESSYMAERVISGRNNNGRSIWKDLKAFMGVGAK